MWLIDKDGRVGIYYRALMRDAKGNVVGAQDEFHITDDGGLTIMTVPLNAANVRQAGLNDIPASRRPKGDVAARLNYV